MISVRSLCVVGLLGLSGCPGEDYVRLYHTQDKAPELDWQAIEDLEHLGPTLTASGVNFGVYSANAQRVDVLLFDDPESNRPTQQFEMSRFGDVWNLYVEGVGDGQHYGYVAWGPNWTYDDDWFDVVAGEDPLVLRRIRGLPWDARLRRGGSLTVEVDVSRFLAGADFDTLRETTPEDGVHPILPGTPVGEVVRQRVRQVGGDRAWELVWQ